MIEAVLASMKETMTGAMERVKDVSDMIPDFEKNKGFEKKSYLPQTGTWEGEKGNSKWYPDRNEVPKKDDSKNAKTWGEILDANGIDGIPYKDGFPVFDEIAQAEVTIDDFSTDRYKNFAQADKKLAEQWNQEGKDGKTDWKQSDIKVYREENKLTWHEKEDMKTMQLIPSEVHNNAPHTGGIAVAKAAMAKENAKA